MVDIHEVFLSVYIYTFINGGSPAECGQIDDKGRLNALSGWRYSISYYATLFVKKKLAVHQYQAKGGTASAGRDTLMKGSVRHTTKWQRRVAI